MSAQDKELVRSTAPGSSGMVVPQGHDPVADAWVPIKVAADGTLLAQLNGSILAEQKTNADAVANVITFSAVIGAIEIYHEEATWQTFTVNGLTLKIPAGGYRTPVGGTASAEVTIPAGISCLVGRLV